MKSTASVLSAAVPNERSRRWLSIPIAWWVACGTTIGVCFGYSGFVVAVIGQFLRPISQAFGWTRAETSGAFSVAMVVTVVMAPLTGWLVDRFGPARMLLYAAISMPFVVVALAAVDGRLWLFYIIVAAIPFVGTATMSTTYTAISLQWFDRYRGVGFGFALAGAGIAQIVLPPLIQTLIALVNWQAAIVGVSVLMLVIVVPLALAFREGPRSTEEIDGGAALSTYNTEEFIAPIADWRQALRTRQLLQLSLVFVLLGVSTFGILVNLPSMLRDFGYSAGVMVTIMSFQGVVSIMARIGTGWLLDRGPPRVIAAAAVAFPAIGVALLIVAPGTYSAAIVAAACFGIGIGGEMDVMAFFVSRYFGRSYAKFTGSMQSLIYIGGAISTPIIAAFCDRTGSYDSGFIAMGGTVLLASVLILTAPRVVRMGQPKGMPIR